MSAPFLSSRDKLVAALTSAWIDGPRGRLLMRAEYGMEACEDFADALLASGVVVTPDVYLAGLAEDEVAVEAIAADQKEAADSWGEPLPGAERSMRARTALRALAAAGCQKRTTFGALLTTCVEGGLTCGDSQKHSNRTTGDCAPNCARVEETP